MPSDELLKCFTITILRLRDEQLFVIGLVNALCSPLQYSFHGYEHLDARNFKRLRVGYLVVVAHENRNPISGM